MASSFTWLDYSEHEKRKMLDVIDLFREKETRDELGIGVVRDAFADMLFPGTSTIQTRARYFLFIPWVYRGLERKRVGSARIAAEARKREVALTRAIVGSGDSRGVFGKQAGVGLKRFASSVYWQGLGTWGILIFPGSQDQYHRSLDAFYKLGEQGERTDDGEPVGEAVVQNWHGGLPPEPAGFLESSSLELSKRDAQYLRERIMASVPDTLLAFLVDTGDELDPLDLNPTQIKALLLAARGDRLEALYVFAIHTGLRRSEILGLTWTDVDLEAGVLSVQRSLDTNGTFNPPKRNKSRRTVKLTDQAIEALKGHRARQNEERLRLGSLWEDHDLVFPNTLGKPMNADNLYHREFKPLLTKAGLSGFTFHSLRHTCATLLCSKNVNPKIVQEMMGHANISQTMDTYSHVLPSMQDEAAAALARALS